MDAQLGNNSASLKIERAAIPALDEMLGIPIPVLDHGHVRIIDYMGNDASIVQAARVSYGKGTKSVQEDAGLIRYLLRHRHTTPFEMCEIKLHVRLPIFVARQWVRHRTASINEYSARYSIVPDLFYVPEPEHMAVQSNANRQGRGSVLSRELATEYRQKILEHSQRSMGLYTFFLNESADGSPSDPERLGLARELARVVLPVNAYTEWYWKTDLHNLLHFLGLRMDAHAQYEIRVYADVIGKIVEDWCPIAWRAFQDYHYNATSLSSRELTIIQGINHGLSKEDIRIIAEEFGWMHRNESGRLKPNRERIEAAEKLHTLGLPIPWGD